MKRPTLLSGITFSILASLLTLPMWWAIRAVVGIAAGVPWVLALTQGAYAAYLLAVSRPRVGFVSLAAANLVVSAILVILPMSEIAHVVLWAVAILLTRCFLFSRNLLSATLELGALIAAGMFAAYLLARTQSMALGVWGFFLVQAATAWIPARAGVGSAQETGTLDPFEGSLRQANAALQQIIGAI